MAMARSVASGWVYSDMSDRTRKRRLIQASHLVVTDGDRCEIQRGQGWPRWRKDNMVIAIAMAN